MFKAFTNELKYYDLFHKDKNYEAEAMSLELKGKTVLEIGSGTGLMTRELENLGFEVTTVEPTDPNADYPMTFQKAYCEDDLIPQMHDNVIALYDVLNYIPFDEWCPDWLEDTDNFIYEIWNIKKGVKFITHKKVDNCYRIRLGIQITKKAHLLYIYWGKGLVISYHKLYLHAN